MCRSRYNAKNTRSCLHYCLRWKKMIPAKGNVGKNHSGVNTNFRCYSVGRRVLQKVRGNIILQELVQAK